MAYEWVENVAALVPDIPPDGILSRTLFKNEHVKAVLFGFDAGQSLSEHQAAQPAVLHILSGEATLTLGDDVREAGPGSVAYMEPRLKHSVLARTPLTMLLLMMAKPESP
jgi:quercetin dioxygenase-like cupin family protein